MAPARSHFQLQICSSRAHVVSSLCLAAVALSCEAPSRPPQSSVARHNAVEAATYSRTASGHGCCPFLLSLDRFSAISRCASFRILVFQNRPTSFLRLAFIVSGYVWLANFLASMHLNGVAMKDVLLFGAASDTETFSFKHDGVANSEILVLEALPGTK